MKLLIWIKKYFFYLKRYRRLVKAGLFNPKFYYEVNTDVKLARVNALKHFLLHGWKEERNSSQYFDVHYYLENNPDVKNSGQEPLQHYLTYGWKEGRNPNEFFDVNYYLNQNPQLQVNGVEPLSHYIKFGWNERLNPSERFDINYYLEVNIDVRLAHVEPLYHFLRYGRYEGRKWEKAYTDKKIGHDKHLLASRPKILLNSTIDILIPIKNNNNLSVFLENLINTVQTPYRILFLDYRREFEQNDLLIDDIIGAHKFCQEILKFYLNAELNVQEMFYAIQNNYCILFPSVQLPCGWLERLIQPIERDHSIAVSVPFINVSSLHAFPHELQNNDIPFSMSINEADSFFSLVNSDDIYQEIPHFLCLCAGFNHSVIDENFFAEVINHLNDEEHVSFMSKCHNYFQRINRKIIHISNLYVYSSDLTSTDVIIPHELITQYSLNNNFKELRDIVLLKMAINNENSVLVFDHWIGGGTEKYTNEILLQQHEIIVRVIEKSRELFIIEVYYQEKMALNITFNHLLMFTVEFLQNVKFKTVYINHLITFSDLELLNYIVRYNCIEAVYLFHDYLAVCPSYNLIDYNGVYCGGETNLQKCDYCIKRNNSSAHGFIKSKLNFAYDIANWRKNFEKILELCNTIVCFSHSSREIVAKIFPSVVNKIDIKPHKLVKLLPLLKQKIDFSGKRSLNIGVLGRVNHSKGKEVIKALSKKLLFSDHTFNLIIIGRASGTLFSNYKVTGKYDVNNMDELVRKHHIDVFINTSIWPETYCYTADEIMAMGFPLISFDIGAHAERIKNYQHGFIVKEISPDAMYADIIKVARYYGFKMVT